MSKDDQVAASEDATSASAAADPHDMVELRPADPNDVRALFMPRADWVAAGEPKTIEELHTNRAAAAKG